MQSKFNSMKIQCSVFFTKTVNIYLYRIMFFLGYIQPIIASNRIVNYSSDVSKSASTKDDEPIQIENPYKRDEKQCILCRLDITPDYKNPRLLSQFQSPYTGKIYGRHITGLCKQKQKDVQRSIKHSQSCGFMPAYHKAPEFLADPKLYDPEKPIRPHPY